MDLISFTSAILDTTGTIEPRALAVLAAGIAIGLGSCGASLAIGIAASRADARATKKQIRSAIEVLGITKDEIVDVLRVVLLTSGMPAFSKSLQILNSVVEAIEEEREDKA